MREAPAATAGIGPKPGAHPGPGTGASNLQTFSPNCLFNSYEKIIRNFYHNFKGEFPMKNVEKTF